MQHVECEHAVRTSAQRIQRRPVDRLDVAGAGAFDRRAQMVEHGGLFVERDDAQIRPALRERYRVQTGPSAEIDQRRRLRQRELRQQRVRRDVREARGVVEDRGARGIEAVRLPPR